MLITVLLATTYLAITDPNFRSTYGQIVSAVFAGYFALSLPNQNQ